jgi:1-acyl-sn-glycerol-3-phosphate acyltransferase
MAGRLNAEDRAAIWGRRVVAVPGALVSFVVVWATLPVTLLLALLWDGVVHRRLAVTRGLGIVVLALSGEVWGIVAGFGAWLVSVAWIGLPRKRFDDWNYGLETRYAGFMFRIARWILGATLVMDGHDVVSPGPILLFIRHAALADTLLPGALVMHGHGIRLRHVLARGLLWAPGLNVVGTRVDNLFVRRGSATELPRIRAMAEDLGPRDGVVIWPEGMVPTPANLERSRARAREKAARRGSDAVPPEPRRRGRLRSRFTHVLPPVPGGPLALLEHAAEADVVFCAHVGFEPVTRTLDLLRGALAGRTVRVWFWRVPRAEIPATRAHRAAWLFEQWERMDEWVAANGDATNGRAQREPDGTGSSVESTV